MVNTPALMNGLCQLKSLMECGKGVHLFSFLVEFIDYLTYDTMTVAYAA